MISQWTGCSSAKGLSAIPLDDAWKEKITKRSPKAPQVEPKEPRKVLIFSLATGFKHWCIPHTESVIQILGEESGAYESATSLR